MILIPFYDIDVETAASLFMCPAGGMISLSLSKTITPF